MATRSQKVKLGVFLTVAVVILATTVIVLTGMGLWEERSSYYIKYHQSVSGLEQGAPVKLRGVRVGTVDQIQVDPDNVEVVEVHVKVDQGTPIKADTRAFINMQGITGLKFVELADGTADAEALPPGSEITAGKSMLEQLTGRASDIGLKVEKTLNNVLHMTREENQKRVDAIMTNTAESTQNIARLSGEMSKTLQVTRSLVADNRDNLDSLIAHANQTSIRTNEALAEITELTTMAQQAVRGAKVPETMTAFRELGLMVQDRLEGLDVGNTMGRVTTALDTLTRLLNNLSQTVNQNQDQLRATIFNIRQAAESFKKLGRSLEAQPSRLFFDEKPEPRDLP